MTPHSRRQTSDQGWPSGAVSVSVSVVASVDDHPASVWSRASETRATPSSVWRSASVGASPASSGTRSAIGVPVGLTRRTCRVHAPREPDAQRARDLEPGRVSRPRLFTRALARAQPPAELDRPVGRTIGAQSGHVPARRVGVGASRALGELEGQRIRARDRPRGPHPMHSRRDADVEESIVETGQSARRLAVHAAPSAGVQLAGGPGSGQAPASAAWTSASNTSVSPASRDVQGRGRDAVGLTGLEAREAVLHLVEQLAVGDRILRARGPRGQGEEKQRGRGRRGRGSRGPRAAVDQESNGEQQDEEQPHQGQEPVHARRDEPESDRLIALDRSRPAEAVVLQDQFGTPGPVWTTARGSCSSAVVHRRRRGLSARGRFTLVA